jgi:hypothetical protein
MLPRGDILQHFPGDPAVLGEVVCDGVDGLDQGVVHHLQTLIHNTDLHNHNCKNHCKPCSKFGSALKSCEDIGEKNME